jgi:hypothetical protein
LAKVIITVKNSGPLPVIGIRGPIRNGIVVDLDKAEALRRMGYDVTISQVPGTESDVVPVGVWLEPQVAQHEVELDPDLGESLGGFSDETDAEPEEEQAEEASEEQDDGAEQAEAENPAEEETERSETQSALNARIRGAKKRR